MSTMEDEGESNSGKISDINVDTFNSKCVVTNPIDDSHSDTATEPKNNASKPIDEIPMENENPPVGASSECEGATKSASPLTEASKEIITDITTPNTTSKPTDVLSPSSKTNDLAVKKKESSFHQTVPKVNCAEKIIICLDMSSEMNELPFKLGDGSQYTPLNMVKRTIEIFVSNKNIIDRRHEFALVALYDTAAWVREFTNDPKELIDTLELLDSTSVCNSCDLSSLFQLLGDRFEMGASCKVPVTLPPFLYRVILVYGRSNCMPHFTDEYEVDILKEFPYLFLDVLYIHEPASSENMCQEIFETLCDLDEHKSYIFEVTRNTTKLHNCMAKLLAHPLQRPQQKDAFYKLRVPDEPEQINK